MDDSPPSDAPLSPVDRRGFEEPEEFVFQLSFGHAMKQQAGTTALLLVVTFLLALGLLNLVHLATPLLAALVAVAFVGTAMYLKNKQWNAKFAQRRLVLDPAGAHVRDRDFTIDLPWAQVTSIGAIPELAVLSPPTMGRRYGVRPGGVSAIASEAQGYGEGLTGPGILAVTPGAGVLFTQQIRQNLASPPRDPVTGQPGFGVILDSFDLTWRQGRIGAWARQMRPDLGA